MLDKKHKMCYNKNVERESQPPQTKNKFEKDRC